jgi:DNA topoisomerase IA
MVVEKEREIKNFKPEESWKIIADLEYNKSKFKAIFTKLD